MAKISGVAQGGDKQKQKVVKTSPQKSQKSQKNFQAQLSKATTREVVDELDKLLEDIRAAGDQLTDEMTWENFIAYRNSVKDFMKMFIGETFELFGSKGRNRMGNQKLYLHIRTVDQKLAEMGEEVLQGEEENLNVVSKIDEIRGLLLDLYQ